MRHNASKTLALIAMLLPLAASAHTGADGGVHHGFATGFLHPLTGADHLAAMVESEAAGLDFPPESFDAALSRFGIIFEPEGEAAAARVRGFLVPGSRMVISSWGPPERVPFIAVPMGTAMRTLDLTVGIARDVHAP